MATAPASDPLDPLPGFGPPAGDEPVEASRLAAREAAALLQPQRYAKAVLHLGAGAADRGSTWALVFVGSVLLLGGFAFAVLSAVTGTAWGFVAERDSALTGTAGYLGTLGTGLVCLSTASALEHVVRLRDRKTALELHQGQAEAYLELDRARREEVAQLRTLLADSRRDTAAVTTDAAARAAGSRQAAAPPGASLVDRAMGTPDARS